MGGGTTPAQTSQVSQVQLPPWVSQASESNYNLAKDIAGRPLEQFGGPTVAAPSDMTTSGYDLIKQLVGSTSPLYDKATGMLDTSAGYGGQAASLFGKQASTLDQTKPLIDKATSAFDSATGVYNEAGDIYRGTTGDLNIQPFLNPYTQEVENRSVANANTSLDQQLLKVRDAQKAAGAFGGSRGDIESAVTRGEGVRNIGDLTAQLRKAGVDYATTTALADRASKQAGAAGLLGVAGGISGAGTGYLGAAGGLRDTAAGYGAAGSGYLGAGANANQAASGYLQTAASKQAAGQQDITNLLTAGQQDQQYRQSQIDAAMKQFYEKRDYPLEGLNTRLAALGMSPYGKTETVNKTATSEDKGPDWATIGLGALKSAPAIAQLFAMSDRNMKTDIEKLTGGEIPMYAYRYKGDPKTYPKVVGPMAQDIQKVRPSAVKKVGKHLVVDINNLMEVLS